jgi:formate hydrogenlyase subunit 6/NADH:ubiquinone oxidoreductase subunit I
MDTQDLYFEIKFKKNICCLWYSYGNLFKHLATEDYNNVKLELSQDFHQYFGVIVDICHVNFCMP